MLAQFRKKPQHFSITTGATTSGKAKASLLSTISKQHINSPKLFPNLTTTLVKPREYCKPRRIKLQSCLFPFYPQSKSQKTKHSLCCICNSTSGLPKLSSISRIHPTQPLTMPFHLSDLSQISNHSQYHKHYALLNINPSIS